MANPRSGAGRPQDTAIHQRIIDATLELIGAGGIEKVTFEEVARKAHTTRPTIYRHWASKDDLIAEALESRRPQIAPPDTGNFMGDIYEATRSFIAAYGTPVGKQVALEILKARSTGSQAGIAWMTKYGKPREEAFSVIFARALERGELSPDLDVRTLMFVLSAALLQLCIVSNESPPDVLQAQADMIVSFLLKGQPF